MNKPLSSYIRFIAASLVLVVIATGSNHGIAKTGGTKSFEFYEDALRLFASKDYRGAIIQLKNALQQDHRNLSARVLLGKSYLSNYHCNRLFPSLRKAQTQPMSRFLGFRTPIPLLALSCLLQWILPRNLLKR